MKALVTALASMCALNACVPEAGLDATPQGMGQPLVGPAPAAVPVPHPGLPEMVDPSCDPRRVVGLGLVNKECPAPLEPWLYNELFDGSSLSSEGRPFCSYALPAGEPYSMAGLPPLDGQPPEQWLQADCPAVTGLGGPQEAATKAIRAVLEQSYRTQIGRVQRLPVLLRSNGDYTGRTKRVEIAILDSLDDSKPSLGGASSTPHATVSQSEHGRAIKSVLSDLTCPSPDDVKSACAVDLRTYQVFDLADGGSAMVADERDGNLTDPKRRKNSGGYVLRLVKRIEDALKSASERRVDNLIILMAVGYHGRFSGHPGPRAPADAEWQWQTATKALLAVLARASEQGAIVIAAIGNRDDGEDPWNTPLFPAYLQGEPMPPGSAPLVFAASAVDAAREPVGNAIGNSQNATRVEAPLAAPGFAVAVPMHDQPTVPILTGSSFGAAGVAATAAIMWSYDPTWPVWKVLRAVHESATPTGRPGQAAQGWLDDEVRSVSVCQAVDHAMAKACEGGESSACQLPTTCPPAPAESSLRSRWRTPAQNLFASIPLERRLAPSTSTMSGGDLQEHLLECLLPPGASIRKTAGAQYECPWLEPNPIGAAYSALSSQPIPLHTSPPKDPCSPCMVAKMATDSSIYKKVLFAQLDPQFNNLLAAPTLRNGNKVLTLGDDWLSAASEGMTAIELPDDFDDDVHALSFEKPEDATSITSYVPVF